MSELYFLRHGERIDHALREDPDAKPILEDYKPYDPSLSQNAIPQIEKLVDEICSLTQAFTDLEFTQRKNVFIHFSPYLRCCQTADLLITDLKASLLKKYPNYKMRFQLLCDFALSEWIHDKMKNKPPFVDSDDAYNMYTPNLKSLKNKSACSMFRPTITLGQYNGLDLSYKDYQTRCKDYFKKLLATYEKPMYIKNKDIIIVVTHGYAVNNFLSYFINHPIFEELPEAKANFAKRVLKDDIKDVEDENDPANYTWKLVHDALDLIKEDGVDTTLNLETDIVYYKTNFIKKDELDVPKKNLVVEEDTKPRPSFKIKETSAAYESGRNPQTRQTYICPAARDWAPNLKHFLIKNEFKEKIMNDESFRKHYNISNHPSRPISPEVSPNSAPTRSNSVIDLSKIVSNDDLQPMKLKYSHTSEIPMHKINSRVNSQVNLSSFGKGSFPQPNGSNTDIFRTNSGSRGSSKEGSTTDLPRYISSMQNRSRSSSNPMTHVHVAHNAKDSYFPSTILGRVKSPESDVSIDSLGEPIPEELDSVLQAYQPTLNEPAGRNSPIESLNRARSLNKRRTNNPLFSSSTQRKLQQLLFQPSLTQLSKVNRQRSLSSGGENRPGLQQKQQRHYGKDDSYDDDGDSEEEEEESNEITDEEDDSNNSNDGNLFSLSFNSSQKKSTLEKAKLTSPLKSTGRRSRKNSFKYKPTTSTKDTGAKSRPIFYNFDSSGDSSSEEEEQEDQDTRKDDEEQDDMLVTKESKDKFVLQKSENKVDGDSNYFWFGNNNK